MNVPQYILRISALVIALIIAPIITGGFFGDEAAAQTLLVEDQFSSSFPSGGTGWSGDWTRSSTSNDVAYQSNDSGRIRIRDAGSMERTVAVDLSGYTSVTLTVRYRLIGLEAGETALIRVNDGGGWRTLLTLANNDDDNIWYVATYNIASVSGVQVGFEINADENNDRFFVNYVQIHGVEASSSGLGISATPTSISENGGTTTVTVTNDGSSSVSVTLSSSNTGIATVSPTNAVTIAAGASYDFTVTGVDNGVPNATQTVTITASGGGETATVDIDVIDDDQALYFDPATIAVTEGSAAVTVQLCLTPVSASNVTVDLTVDIADEITLTETSVTISGGSTCSSTTIDVAVDGNDLLEEVVKYLVVTATDSSGTPTYADGTLNVTVLDDDVAAILLVITPNSFSENGGTTTGRVSRGPSTSGPLTVALNSSDTGEATVPASVTIPDGDDYVEFTITGVDDSDEDGPQNVVITATAGSLEDTATVTVNDDELVYGPVTSIHSQAFPTALFIASYDWLATFFDENQQKGDSRDPDTDNFNKILLKDSNLFPLYTATINDTEFPNITSRNTDFMNDYMNRSVAAAPNYINTTTYIPTGDGLWDIKAVGMRSSLDWVFVTDPANHNIRRYQFAKHQGFYYELDFSDIIGTLGDPSLIDSDDSMMECDTGHCSDGEWYVVEDTSGWFNCNPGGNVMYYPKKIGNAQNSVTGTFSFTITLPDAVLPLASLPIDFIVDGHDASSELTAYLNKDDATEQTSASTDLDKLNQASCGMESTTFTNIDDTFDIDASTSGVQVEITVDADKNHGGMIIAGITINQADRQDRGFGVDMGGGLYYDYTDAQREARWNDIGTFLETVPPRSYRGYAGYRQLDTALRSDGGIASPKPNIGYGFQTNTSFDTAENVRFKNPRDIDLYRDYFDVGNGGPTYVFVADTMNSRIQVFMNATGSAGETGASFPVRPVRVKGPNDTAGGSTAYESNELAKRIHQNITGESTGFGDGRKADWRQSLVNYTSGGSAFIENTVGQGEFFYPHGVAVDQDPDTKDVYVFVADTYNHRIQVFRDATGVSYHNITSKRFDFEYETGWGSYPLPAYDVLTSYGPVSPGPYNFSYPKGIDVARFANNSSYLYVVDSKNARVMKYLISEDESGIQSISAANGYGYDDSASAFANDVLSEAGAKMDSTGTSPGFLNPQDVASGYNGFFLYESDGGNGVKFLNNYMFYVTDYARNDTSTTQAPLNMRVMQFIDVPHNLDLNGVWLPWATETIDLPEGGPVEQSIFSTFDDRFGSYNSRGESTSSYSARPGPPENSGTDNVFTERPVGIATLAWNTTEPFDMRVTDGTDIFLNGATIGLGVAFEVGAASGQYFSFPESDLAEYTNYRASVNGRRIGEVHVFWYNNDGSYRTHASDASAPFEFDSDNTQGYMKVIATDTDFKYSGRSGTQIFRLSN
ncbi:MAG: hypothetical protein GY801_35600 [bacterium]|nr:hypothetical protein [bacterium]